MNYKYFFSKVKRKFLDKDAIIKYYRSTGMSIGSNCKIYSHINTSENYLIKIGNNVTISTGVKLVTHDNSVIKLSSNGTDVFGKISIGNNSFIGLNSIIMYGVTLHPNTIVAAGAVVTKSTTAEGQILGGNPAKVIGTSENFFLKVQKKIVDISKMDAIEKKKVLEDENMLIKR